jgi:uncharacterized membrane protein YkvA (DUF1232 family)
VVWELVVGALAGLLVVWIVLLAVLWRNAPDERTARDSLRLLPDVVRLVGRLARDTTVPGRARVLLVVLLAYLLSPIDLVPDFVPVVGYADDAIVIALVLRWVVRWAGREAIERHWTGTAQGLAAVERLAGVRSKLSQP